MYPTYHPLAPPSVTLAQTLALIDDVYDYVDLNFQPYDADLEDIAALAPSDGSFLKRVGGVWAGALIGASDLTEALKTPPAIGGTTPAAVTGTVITATSQILIPGGGSSGALKLAFSDGNTGFYEIPSPDQIVITIEGTNQATMFANYMQSVTNNGAALRWANGVAAAPIYTFVGDTNTGMYRGGTDILSFATGGVERGRFDASGMFDVIGDLIRLRTTKTPASATDTAVGAGLICWDASYLYISTGVNTWRRIPHASW